MLLREIIRRLASKGAQEIYLEVDPKNRAALNLYLKLGFTVECLTMHLEVQKPGFTV